MQDLFKDLVVVEFASILAGPSVGLFFAELGAQVIKIENKTSDGDATRKWKLPEEKTPLDQPSAYYVSVNRGKESILLNLKETEDLNKAMEIVSTADVVLTNFKKSSAAALGIEPKQLLEKFPQLIVGVISGYHHKADPAFDVLLQAETGYISMNGSPGNPARMPVALIDILAGHQLKEGVLCALIKLQRTGEGSIVSVSLYDSAVASLANQASNYLLVGHVPQPMGCLHPNIAPYGEVFTSSDEVQFILAIGTEKQWNSLIFIYPSLRDDKWSNNSKRLECKTEIRAVLTDQFVQKKWSILNQEFVENSIPASKILNVGEVLEDPYVIKNLLYKGGTKSVVWKF